MKKTLIKYIGIFLILFGSGVILLSVYSPKPINAQDTENDSEDIKKISDEFKQGIPDYMNIIEQAENESLICNEDIEGRYDNLSILEYIDSTSIDQYACEREIKNKIEEIKKELEIKLILKTNNMLNTRWTSINTNMKNTLKLLGEIDQKRKEYGQ